MKEHQECDTPPVLDLKQEIDIKTRKTQCLFHFKKTHIKINMEEKSSYPDTLKIEQELSVMKISLKKRAMPQQLVSYLWC